MSPAICAPTTIVRLCCAYAIDRIDQCPRFIVRAEEGLPIGDASERRSDPPLARSIDVSSARGMSAVDDGQMHAPSSAVLSAGVGGGKDLARAEVSGIFCGF
jgi:hypothetical protein